MIVVHVIGPHLSDRFELHYSDGYTDKQILHDLKKSESDLQPGDLYKRVLIGPVKVMGEDINTGADVPVASVGPDGLPIWVVDHPDTVVAVGELYIEKGWKQFRELRRIQGGGGG